MTSIFVSMASYRDPEMLPTIEDAYSKAKEPNDIYFGVCNQLDCHADRWMLPAKRLHKNIKVLSFNAQDSAGVGWAKATAQSLWNGEDYVLNIDSHMRFVQDWDELLCSALEYCPSKKPVLSTYAPSYIPPTHLRPTTPVMYPTEFTNGGMLLFKGMHKSLPRPISNPFLSGHFYFADAQFIHDVPYDPHIYFHGEEISMAVRAWTYGWDIFTPNTPILFHYYGRHEQSKHWDDHNVWDSMQLLTEARVNHLLDNGFSSEHDVLNGLDSHFGLGTERSLKSYEEFSGVNFKERIVLQRQYF